MIAIDLAGTTALVTGASSGIGAAVATRLAEAGCHVVLHHRTDVAGVERVRATIEAAGGSAEVVRAELTTPDEVEAMFDVAGASGPCRVLVNNAGSYPVTPLLEMTEVEWSQVVADNLTSAALCIGAAARRLRDAGGGGAFVNVGSLSALRPADGQSHYNAAKAGVLSLTASAAVELAPFAIRVNAVSPGLVERPSLHDDWPDGVARWQARAPLGRLGRPDDVADACLFLASPMAAWITGQNLVVDGGISVAPAY